MGEKIAEQFSSALNPNRLFGYTISGLWMMFPSMWVK
jgi:hypothetical protein